MSSDQLTLAYQHLLHVVGLCQTSRDLWTESDRKDFLEAREFLQNWKERLERGSTTVKSED